MSKTLLELIKDENYDIGDLSRITEPISSMITSKTFAKYLTELVTIITKDRNNDNKFTVKDIYALSTNIFAMGSLVKALVLILISLPKIEVTVENEAIEDLMLNLLVYIFLVVIPKETDMQWDGEEKRQILQAIVIIYESILSKSMVREGLEKISEWLNENIDIFGWIKTILTCGLIRQPRLTKQKVYQRHMSKLQEDIVREWL